MSSNVGIWSPNDLILPTVDSDLDYKFFFVTEAGNIDGLDISFNAGDWLVYIKKDGKATWHKSTGGIVNYNGDSSSSNLDPGYYSKIRIDNAGNIIDAGYINLEDLPKHNHDINDITGDIEAKIKDTVGQMFQQHHDSSVKFQYDPSTKCVTAEVNYDDATITRNEFGELVAHGGGGEGSGVDPEAYTCGTHTHGVSQIDGFEDAVKKIIDKNVTVDVHNIPIDGETIKLNSVGQLTAVSSGNKQHDHKMSDIKDLNPNIANVWASNQILQRDQDYTKGLLNVTNQTVGYAIRVINEYLTDITDRVENIGTKMDSITIPEPTDISYTSLDYTYLRELAVYDKDSFNEVQAGYGVRITSGLFYPSDKGKVTIYVDNKEYCTLDLENVKQNNGMLRVLKKQDSYFGNPMYMGKYESVIVEFTSTSLDEGYHTAYLQHNINNKLVKTSEIKFQTYTETQPKIENKVISVPEHNSYVSGVPCYTGDGLVQIEPSVRYAFSKNFIAKDVFKYIINGEEFTSKIRSISSDIIHFEPITTYVDKESSGITTIKEYAFNVSNKRTDSSFSTSKINWNNTNVEVYRTTLGSVYETQIPIDVGSVENVDYDSKEPVDNHEMIVVDNIGIIPNINYSDIKGPNYKNYSPDINGYVWVTLKFKAPFMNNLHINCFKKLGQPFKKMNSGLLSGIQLFVAQSNTNTPTTWVNGNMPYNGYGSVDSMNWAGLDLFKSNEYERHITFGQRPNIEYGNLFVRIGVMDSIDLASVVSSVKESIDEWS